MKQVLSLGAGVQSSTLLLMSIHGELPKLDYAIFADTGWEPKAVYLWLDFLREKCEEAGIVLLTGSVGNIKEDTLRVQVNYQGNEAAQQLQKGMTKDGRTRWGSMPLMTLNPDGSYGQVRRQCTYEYKIRVIERLLRREVLQLKPRQRAPKEVVVRQWYGISWDERQRMRKADQPFITNWYPLVENHTSRLACLDWLRSHGYREAPRSACIGCPYHSDKEWREMKLNRPDEFEDACEFDEAIRDCGGMRGKIYLHASRRPLREVDFRNDFDKGQLPLWHDECSGMCGT